MSRDALTRLVLVNNDLVKTRRYALVGFDAFGQISKNLRQQLNGLICRKAAGFVIVSGAELLNAPL